MKKHFENTHKLDLVRRGAPAATVTPDLLVTTKTGTILLVMGGQKEATTKNFIDYLQDKKNGIISPTQREYGDVLSEKIYAIDESDHYIVETDKSDEVMTFIAYVNQLRPDIAAIQSFEELVQSRVEQFEQSTDTDRTLTLPPKPLHLRDLVLAWDGDINEAIYRILNESYQTPFVKQWLPQIITKLREKGLIQECNVYSFGQKKSNLEAVLIATSIYQLRQIITEGIQSMELEFFAYESFEAEEDKLSPIREVGEYITTFGPELAKTIEENIDVDFDPAVDRHHPTLIDMNLHANERGITGYYPPQANTMMGVSRTLMRDSFAFLIGEMGSGKSAMGAGLPYLTQALETSYDHEEKGLEVKPARVFLLSPAIMVHKWKREVEDRVPNVKVTIIESWLDLQKLREESIYTVNGKTKFKKPEQMEYYIMSAEAPKVSFLEEPIRDYRYSKEQAMVLKEEGERPRIGMVGTRTFRNSDVGYVETASSYKGSTYYCPNCKKPILKKVGSGRNEEYHPVGVNHFGAFDRKTETFKDLKRVENSFCKSMVNTSHLPKEKVREWTYDKETERYVPAEDTQVCGYELWQPQQNLSKGKRKVSPVWYLNKYFPRGFFKYLVADEVHEYKGGKTKIGNAFGQLVNHTEKQILLTGTLFGGMARDIFYLLARLAPDKLARESLNFKEESLFNALYGVFESTTTENEETGRTKTNRVPKPGISPHLFPMYLMGNAAFLELNDMGYALPPYREIPKIIPMESVHRYAYNKFSDDFMTKIKEIDTLKGIGGVSAYMNLMYQYADEPKNFSDIEIYDKEGQLHYICTPINLDESYIPAKLRELHRVIDEEIAQGRKNLVYVKYTGKNSHNRMDTHLYEYFKELGYNVGILCNDSSYDGIKMPKSSTMREQWLNDMMAKHEWDILITNPRLVKVGLDLLAFPNIHFYQLDYSTFDYMQASRRSWRIRQTLDVQVFTYVYEDSIQDKALKHIARKIDASLAMQGKFSEEGLRAMAESSDGMNALAKELLANDVLSELTESVEDIFARKNQSFEEMQSVEFQEYEYYIMNPIEGGIDRIREIASGMIKKVEKQLEEGKVTRQFVKAAKETIDNYMDMVERFTKVVEDTKEVNKGIRKANQLVKGQVTFDFD